VIGTALTPSAVLARSHRAFEGEGLVIGVNTDDGVVILENGNRYDYLHLDQGTRIVRIDGNALEADDLRPGDVFVYRFEVRYGAPVATDIAILPASVVGRR
jgi:hypothetical protein